LAFFCAETSFREGIRRKPRYENRRHASRQNEPKDLKMRKWVLTGGLIAMLVATACNAQRGERLSRECRKEVVELCGMTRDRDAIGKCLREKKDQLSASCTGEIMQRLGERREGQAPRPAAAEASEYGYGSDTLQKFDFWPATKADTNPGLVVFVHGGGWSRGDKASGTGTKPAFYTDMGYAFASLNYRLVPAATVEQQAADIASALAYLRSNADRLGFDANRITLMGHSAGAHLAALVSSDTRYLDAAKVPVSAIKGTILLDGAGYDVAAQMTSKNNLVQRMYGQAFGSDPVRQKALSPISHAGDGDVGNWLILHVESRDASARQSTDFAKALADRGAKAKVMAVPDSTHMTVNRDAGVADSFVGKAIAGFLKG
jgi:arylformamidase